MIERDDDQLRNGFEALRRADAAGTPSFRATLAAARARQAASRGHRALRLAAAVVALLAAAVVWTWRGRDTVRLRIDLATVRWQAPTDFLLTLPGDELLRSVPQLGSRGLDWRSL